MDGLTWLLAALALAAIGILVGAALAHPWWGLLAGTLAGAAFPFVALPLR